MTGGQDDQAYIWSTSSGEVCLNCTGMLWIIESVTCVYRETEWRGSDPCHDRRTGRSSLHLVYIFRRSLSQLYRYAVNNRICYLCLPWDWVTGIRPLPWQGGQDDQAYIWSTSSGEVCLNCTGLLSIAFLTLETGISANFDVRRMLSHRGGWDKPIPEVIHLWRHRTSTPNNLEQSRLVCLIRHIVHIFRQELEK